MGFFANADVSVLIAFAAYLFVMLGIGFYFSNKSKKMSDYFLAGRGLNSWVTAMSAQASDMSGWLLMGLPGAAYATGMGNYWIAIGLAIGTILNWAFVAKPLRRFTEAAGDSITIPQYLQNRFKKGIYSHETALFLWDLTDRTPNRYCMTFPENYNLTNPKEEY